MSTVRRSLSVLSSLLLLVLGTALALFMLNDAPRRPLPSSFVVMFAVVPALAHVVSSALAWRREATGSPVGKSLFSLACSAISGFAWLTILAASAEYFVRNPLALRWWQAMLIVIVGALLPLSCWLNAAYFRHAVFHQTSARASVGI